ncbi:hypothetical protein R6Z07F_020409 [Ovis aries]
MLVAEQAPGPQKSPKLSSRAKCTRHLARDSAVSGIPSPNWILRASPGLTYPLGPPSSSSAARQALNNNRERGAGAKAGLCWLAPPPRAPQPPPPSAWRLGSPGTPPRRPESFYRGHRCLTWYLHLALQLAIGGATCGRALCLARPDQPAPAPRSLLRLAQPSMQP